MATGGDITDDQGIATWTASCTSQGNITSYTWDGTDLGADGAAYPYTFAKKGDEHTPTLFVANDDNTVQEVKSCPAVKATDSSIPDYEILANQNDGKIPIPAGKTQVHVKVPIGGQSCVIFCETTYTPELQGALTMKVGSVSNKGNYNVTVSLPVDSCDDDMLDFDLSAEATCGVQ